MSHRKYSLFLGREPIEIVKYIEDDEEVANSVDTLKNIKTLALSLLEDIYLENKKHIESLTEKSFK